MKLRTRILTGFGLVLLVFAALGVAVVVDQRGQLIDQLDRRLEAVAPLNRQAPRNPGGSPPPAGTPREAPISDVFIEMVEPDGSSEVLVQGQLLTDQPALDEVDVLATGMSFMTVDSVDGSTQFRVLVDRPVDAAPAAVIALPTSDVD